MVATKKKKHHEMLINVYTRNWRSSQVFLLLCVQVNTATECGLASAHSFFWTEVLAPDATIDQSGSAVPQPERQICLRFKSPGNLRSRKNSFPAAFQVLQHESMLPILVDPSNNWRGMHDSKNQEIHQADKSRSALSGLVASRRLREDER
jgi:hypothetical protein